MRENSGVLEQEVSSGKRLLRSAGVYQTAHLNLVQLRQIIVAVRVILRQPNRKFKRDHKASHRGPSTLACAQLTKPLAMGYHITLSRPESSKGISAQDWTDLVASRTEVKLPGEETHFITAILDGDENLALHYSPGDCSVFTKNPEGPRIIEYMASIAPHFGGIVTGDEGETFSSAADWGTQNDWDSQTASVRRHWWQQERFLEAGESYWGCFSALSSSLSGRSSWRDDSLANHLPKQGRTKRIQATARRLSVVPATPCARRRLIRDVRPR